MSDYKVGEVVDITIKGARIIEVSGQSIVYTYPGLHTLARSAVAPDAEAVTVERVAPAEWPPRKGDLWRDRQGDLWFARIADGDDWSTLVLTCDVPYAFSDPDKVLATYAPLTLVHREAEQDGGDRG